MVPQIHRFTPLGLKRGSPWDKFPWPFQSSPQARDARLEKSHLPNDFLMFVSSGEICHAFNLLQKKSGKRGGFMIFKCSNISFSGSVFITIMFVADEISQDQELMLLSATNAFSISVQRMLKLSFCCFRSEEKPLAHTLPLPLVVNATQLHLPFTIRLPLLSHDFPLLRPLELHFSLQASQWAFCKSHLVLFRLACEKKSVLFTLFWPEVLNTHILQQLFSFPATTSVSARFPVAANQCGSSFTTSNVQTGVIRWSGSHFKPLCSSTWHLNLE